MNMIPEAFQFYTIKQLYHFACNFEIVNGIFRTRLHMCSYSNSIRGTALCVELNAPYNI